MSMCTAISAWYWLRDPRTTVVPLTESLWIHPVFTVATLTLGKNRRSHYCTPYIGHFL